MKKLIFDIAKTGHHSEYIKHLIDYLFEAGTGGDIIFMALHFQFKESFPEIYAKASSIENVHWHQITQAEFDIAKKGNPIKKSLNEYAILNRYAKKFQVDHVVSMDFHCLKYGSIFNRSPYTISSIQFLNFYRMPRATFSEKKEYYKLFLLAKLSSLNKKVTQVFILNDTKAVDHMNDKFGTDAYRLLPDPIEKLTPAIDFDVYEHYQISRHKKIFLHIGSLGDRKGSLQVAEAASYIPDGHTDDLVVLIVGRAHVNREREILRATVNEFQDSLDVRIIWDEQFVDTPIMKSLFDQCFAVLIPYKNSEFSSGILGHAAAAKKPVMATNSGLIKILVEKYNLGVLVNEVTGEQIALKMVEMLELKIKPDIDGKFVDSHAPQVFAQTILATPN